MDDFSLGTKVAIMGNHELIGKVVGSATEINGSYVSPLILIELEDGFYNPEQTMFVRIIAAHAASLETI